jgi:hypothetical protein
VGISTSAVNSPDSSKKLSDHDPRSSKSLGGGPEALSYELNGRELNHSG